MARTTAKMGTGIKMAVLSTESVNAARGDGTIEADIGARLDRLPLSAWHFRAVFSVGLATFFDAFDALTIAFVLPVLAGVWHLVPGQIGLLISVGYVGQLIGAVGLCALAERLGRLYVLRVAVAILALLSIACAFAPTFEVLLVLRFLQGIGLGAEVPIAATFINELSPARYRGRLVFLLESAFALGVAITPLVAFWLIPTYGWQAMFVFGGLPLLVAAFVGLAVPESPRWLAGHGTGQAAEAAMARIERSVSRNGTRALPTPVLAAAVPHAARATFTGLLRDGYAGRTLMAWTIMFCTSLAGYGLLAWLPTIYRTVYAMPLSDVLRISGISGIAGLAAVAVGTVMIDTIGRRATFTIAFSGCALPLLTLWALLPEASVMTVVILASISYFFISILLAGVYAYVPEIYPTRMRALGAGAASAWLRVASILGPTLVGALLTYGSVGSVFLFFGLSAAVGAVVVVFFLIETRGRPLEEIAT